MTFYDLLNEKDKKQNVISMLCMVFHFDIIFTNEGKEK
jgi:hypothetical protein